MALEAFSTHCHRAFPSPRAAVKAADCWKSVVRFRGSCRVRVTASPIVGLTRKVTAPPVSEPALVTVQSVVSVLRVPVEQHDEIGVRENLERVGETCRSARYKVIANDGG
jgi:hypothetical protein